MDWFRWKPNKLTKLDSCLNAKYIFYSDMRQKNVEFFFFKFKFILLFITFSVTTKNKKLFKTIIHNFIFFFYYQNGIDESKWILCQLRNSTGKVNKCQNDRYVLTLLSVNQSNYFLLENV